MFPTGSPIPLALILLAVRMPDIRIPCSSCWAFVPPPSRARQIPPYHYASLPILRKDSVLHDVPSKQKKENHPTDTAVSNGTRIPRPSVRTQLSFARDGHCVLRKIVSSQRIAKLRKKLTTHARQQELLAWQQKVEVATQSQEQAQACQTVVECQRALADLGASVDLPFLQYFNTWRSLPEVLEIAKELAPVAATLLDCDSIRLYQDSIFWKRAGDGPTPWHTDGRMAPFDTSLLVTFWIPLQDIPYDGSALVFCSKSHSDFALPYWNEYSKTYLDPASPWNRLEDRYGGEKALVDYMPLSMGDVTAHSGWVLHCADAVPVDAGGDRMALAISFVDASAPVRQSLIGTAKLPNGDAGDPEDAWSYREWINQVPVNQPYFQHDRVPILFPTKKRRQRSHVHYKQSQK